MGIITPSGAMHTDIIDALRDLQQHIGEANAAKGFHEEGDWARDIVTTTNAPASVFRNYATARLALITTEVAEAIEELRHGRAVDETYYLYEDGGEAVAYGSRPASVDPMDRPRKPEGVPSELADVQIRVWDIAHEFGIDLAAAIEEKLAYNATRAHKHGKEF